MTGGSTFTDDMAILLHRARNRLTALPLSAEICRFIRRPASAAHDAKERVMS
jgi:hypothetical protein